MINVYISQSWKYENTYSKLMNLLKSNKKNREFIKSYFLSNSSINIADPDNLELKNEIKKQMSNTECVLIYDSGIEKYSRIVELEISVAKKCFANPKKVIVVLPRGAQTISTYLAKNADDIVRWNSSSISNSMKCLW